MTPGPLRKVVGEIRPNPKYGPTHYVLECGHTWYLARTGGPAHKRRRCYTCASRYPGEPKAGEGCS